jgi:molecular chaperone IbpA
MNTWKTVFDLDWNDVEKLMTSETIGYRENLQRLIDDGVLTRGRSGYPPYNLVRAGEDLHRLEIAVAGFQRHELSVVSEKSGRNELTVSGKKDSREDEPSDDEYIHRGLANRDFELKWTLAEHVEVESTWIDDGVLYLNLVRVVPEEEKPKRHTIERPEEKRVQIGEPTLLTEDA